MQDWLFIQREQQKDPRLIEFIQANPVLDRTMRTILAYCLNLREPSLEKWIQQYHNATGECMQC